MQLKAWEEIKARGEVDAPGPGAPTKPRAKPDVGWAGPAPDVRSELCLPGMQLGWGERGREGEISREIGIGGGSAGPAAAPQRGMRGWNVVLLFSLG